MKNTETNTKKSMHSEMGPVRQNPIQRTVRTAHLRVHNFSTQYITAHSSVLLISRKDYTFGTLHYNWPMSIRMLHRPPARPCVPTV